MLDRSSIESLAAHLVAISNPTDVEAAVAKYYTPSWPDTYVNSDTGRPYTPHNANEYRFVYSDTPLYALCKGGEGAGKTVAGVVKTFNRLRRGVAGVMVCVAADTLVDGIPIAERVDPAPVNTLFGPAWASSSFREGRADLFRVVTESGEEVVVTASHRFLTPVGWRPLSSLRVGDAIAADGSEHGQTWREISPGSLADCWLGPHPCGGFASLEEQYVQSKEPQLAERGLYPYPTVDCQAHAYTDRFSCPSSSVVDGGVYWPSFGVGVDGSLKSDISYGVSRWASQFDNLSKWPHGPISHSVGNDAEMQNDRFDWSRSSPEEPNNLSGWQLPLSLIPGQTNPESRHSCICVDYPYLYYNTEYAIIVSITFQRYGDFYGLTVPSIGHYSAHGLFHHNSPDLPHFRRSLWPEFRRWCPWDQVVPEQRYRSKFSWEPRAPFSIAFLNGATLLCGGIDDPGAWEGPNISFAYMDEMRRKKTAAALKVLSGRVRIPGPDGEPPQLYITTTPRKHWLYEYFGPLKCKCNNCSRKFEHEVDSTIPVVCPHCTSSDYSTDDPRADFKLQSLVITLLTIDNEPNLSANFTANRALSLSSAEARVLLEAAWEDVEGGERFLPSMLMWDTCKEDLPPLTKREPLVLAMDAATGRSDSSSDCFGIVGVTRHPDPERHGDSIAVRFVQKWQAKAGQKINFRGTEHNPGPELVVRTLCSHYNVVVVTYDPDQLHDMGERLSRERIAWMLPFTQRALRVKSDTDLLNLVVHRRIAHDGDVDLRDHVSNADRKLDDAGKRLRIVKREESLKIDLCVCLSMASLQALRLNL